MARRQGRSLCADWSLTLWLPGHMSKQTCEPGQGLAQRETQAHGVIAPVTPVTPAALSDALGDLCRHSGAAWCGWRLLLDRPAPRCVPAGVQRSEHADVRGKAALRLPLSPG